MAIFPPASYDQPSKLPLPGQNPPPWAFQTRLAAYLGYDPFTDPTLGSPKRNESSCVAFLSPDAPVTLGQKIKQHRLKLRKTRKQMASELGVSVKTLWGWETDRWLPTNTTLEREMIDLLKDQIKVKDGQIPN
jgi:DNA-binding XRE family transcriptional regulator